jgi:hydroxyacylglutathione hydrolase
VAAVKIFLCLVCCAALVGCDPTVSDLPLRDSGVVSGGGSDAAVPDSGSAVDGSVPFDAGTVIPDAGFDAGVPDAGTGPSDAGTFPAWIHGSSPCSANTDPPIQVHQVDADTFILRQNKCVNYEAPFIYLLFGQTKVLMLDSGATSDPARFPIRATVQTLIGKVLAARGQASIALVVSHSHSHGDHVAGDGQFTGQPNTTVVQPSAAAVQTFFGFTSWPNQTVNFDLGGRVLQIIGIPGHEAAHIAIYDPNTRWLLTGDTLYPGRLYIRDWAAYRASVARLVVFTQTHPFSYVMGTHVEMSSTPRVDYPVGTTFQPKEHVLQLAPSQLTELNDALIMLGGTPTRQVHDAFIIDPI